MASENPDLQILLRTEIIQSLIPAEQSAIAECVSPCLFDRITNTPLYQTLLRLLKDEGLKILVKQFQSIKNSEEYNITTIIAEIYAYQPNDGILHYLKNDPLFFKGKMFLVEDPDAVFSGLDEITKVTIFQSEANKCSTHTFEFKNGNRFILKTQFSTNHLLGAEKVYKSSCDLLNFLATVQPDGIIQIEAPKTTDVTIASGNYELTSKHKSASTFLKPSTNIIYTYLLMSKTNSRKYEINVEYTEDLKLYSIAGVFSIEASKGKSPLQNFITGKYRVVRENRANLDKIVTANINDCIKIKPRFIDANREMIEKMMAIKKYHAKLVDYLAMNSQHHYLDKLLEDLSLNELKFIRNEALISDLLLKNPKIEKKLNKIFNLQIELGELGSETSISKTATKEDLKKVSIKEILKKVCLEANYARLINKIQQVPIYRTMELLQEAFESIKKMKESNLVLFFGNTGAGKSTATSYYLGVDLEIKDDTIFGRTVVEVKNPQDNGMELTAGQHYPKIGQSIAASETTYVRGFNLLKLPDGVDKSLMLADFPGTKDTHGPDHDLATHLSIDQTVKVANSIKAIVLTIPYSDFFKDRGTPILDIFQTLLERVPNILDPACEARKSLFLVISMHPNHPNKDKIIENVFRTHISQAVEDWKRAFSQTNNDAVVVGFFKKNILIWETLLAMLNGGRVDFINVENNAPRRHILTKLSNAPGIKKEEFAKAMESSEVQRNFGDCIQMSIHTWQKLIIEHYLENLPKEIEVTRHQIAQLEEDIKTLKVSEKTSFDRIRELEKIMDNKCQTLNRLKRGDVAAAQGEVEKLLNEIRGSKKDRMGTNKQESMVVTQNIQGIQNALKNKEVQISRYQEAHEQAQKRISALHQRIKDLSEGTYDDKLWELKKFKRGAQMKTDHFKEGRQWAAFNEVRELRDSDFDSSDIVIAGKYNGELVYHAYISRNYYIVPENMHDRERFFRDRHVDTRIGRYVATVTGKCYAPDLGVRAAPGGKQMVYSFTTFWKAGGVIPWIKIIHSIPNHSFNHALIVNLYAEINAEEKKLAECEATMKMLKTDSAELEQELQLESKKLVDLNNELAALEAQQLQAGIQGLIAEYEQYIVSQKNNIENEHKQMEDNKNKLARRIEELKAAKEKYEGLLKEKMHFAILIKTQRDIVELLMDFSKLASDSLGFEKKKVPGELFVTCTEFKEFFKENERKLFEACDNDLSAFTLEVNTNALISSANNSPPLLAAAACAISPLQPSEKLSSLQPIRIAPAAASPIRNQLTPGVGHDGGANLCAVIRANPPLLAQSSREGAYSAVSSAAAVGLFPNNSHLSGNASSPRAKSSVSAIASSTKPKAVITAQPLAKPVAKQLATSMAAVTNPLTAAAAAASSATAASSSVLTDEQIALNIAFTRSEEDAKKSTSRTGSLGSR